LNEQRIVLPHARTIDATKAIGLDDGDEPQDQNEIPALHQLVCREISSQVQRHHCFIAIEMNVPPITQATA